MSIVIKGWAPAYPGIDRVKGNVLTTKEVLDSAIGKDGGKLARKITEQIESKSGIKLRSVIDPTLEDPNTYLASASAYKLLQNLSMHPSKVEGFIFASNTPDYVFPPPGVPVMHVLGLNPMLNDYKANACSSFVSAIDEACYWIKEGRVKNVLIVACDITTRLGLPNNFVERLLFGDGAVAVLLEAGGPQDKGGFILTDQMFHPVTSSLVQHRNYRSLDIQRQLTSPAPVSEAVGNNKKSNEEAQSPLSLLLGNHHLNDDGYTILGSIDGREWAYILLDYKHKTGGLPNKVLPPQIGNAVILKGASVVKEIEGIDIKPYIVDGSFQVHGNTGAAALPIALYEGIISGKIKFSESVGAPFVPLGGRSGYFAYDPNLGQIIKYVNIEDHERIRRDDYSEVIKKKKDKINGEKARSEKYLERLGLPKVKPIQPHPDGDYVERVQRYLSLIV